LGNLNKYKLDKIEECNINNGYKQEFQIEQLFAFYNNDINFCIKIYNKMYCSIYYNYKEKIIFFPA